MTNKKKDILTFKPTDEYIDYQTNSKQIKNIIKFYDQGCSVGRAATVQVTICPKSSDPFYIVTYYLNWVKTFWNKVFETSMKRIIQTDTLYSQIS